MHISRIDLFSAKFYFGIPLITNNFVKNIVVVDFAQKQFIGLAITTCT